MPERFNQELILLHPRMEKDIQSLHL